MPVAAKIGETFGKRAVLQRASINNYQIKIQGVVTCNFLCMDRCGLLYGSREFTDDCVFNEMMESHHFNTYSSAKYSNDKRTLYLALNKKGIPRKVQTKAKASLGKMETYTNVLTKPVSAERVEALALKIERARVLLGKFLQGSSEENTGRNHLLRHHRYQFCPSVPITKLDEKNKFKCRKREKRKKKRKCKDDDYDDDCVTTPKKKTNGKCDDDEDEEECQKRLHGVRQKRKSRNGSETDSQKCPGGKCTDDKEKKKKKRMKSDKKKFSDKTSKSKSNSETDYSKRKGPLKGFVKEKAKSNTYSAEETVTPALLWKDALQEIRSQSEVTEKFSVASSMNIATDKISEEYEDEEDQTEKFVDIEDDSSEIGNYGVTQSSSSSLGHD